MLTDSPSNDRSLILCATVVALTFAATLLVGTSSALAEVPNTLSHQGKLLDDQGEPVTGEKELTFRFYDSETGGMTLWESTQTVTLDESGFYSVELGPLDEGVLQGGDVWIGVSVGGGDEMTPRLRLNAVPYAIEAGNAQSVADGAIDSSAFADDFTLDEDQITTIPWQKLEGIPIHLADGDDDTLDELGCGANQIAKYDGMSWTCAPDNDTLTGLGCAQGQVAKYDGMTWRCAADDDTTDWTNITNKPTDLEDGDDDTLASLNCQNGYVAQYDGTDWVCSAVYSDADAQQAISNQDAYLQNTGDTMKSGTISGLANPSNPKDAATKQYVDRAQEDRDLNSNAIKNVDWKNSDSPFAFAVLELNVGNNSTNAKYFSSDGTSEGGLSIPSNGNTSCTTNGRACMHNVQGNYFQIGIKIPKTARRIPWGGGSDHMCWPVPVGDQDPIAGAGDSWSGPSGSGVERFSTDNAGQNMGHCINGAPDNNYAVGCIITAGADQDSDTHYGIVCMK